MTEIIEPSSKLSEAVVDRMIDAGLLRADKRASLIAKMASGEMDAEDWKLEVELAAAKAKSE